MKINEYQAEALRTATGASGDVLVNGALGLCGESGEVADAIKKHMYQGHELDTEHIVEELGDVAWYLAVTAYALGYDLETVLRRNVAKLQRRYPDGFEAARSINRAEVEYDQDEYARRM